MREPVTLILKARKGGEKRARKESRAWLLAFKTRSAQARSSPSRVRPLNQRTRIATQSACPPSMARCSADGTDPQSPSNEFGPSGSGSSAPWSMRVRRAAECPRLAATWTAVQPAWAGAGGEGCIGGGGGVQSWGYSGCKQ